MPVITRPAMTPGEQAEFSQAAQEILLAQSDGYCRIDLCIDPSGTPRIVSENHARGSRAAFLDDALTLARKALRDGKAVITHRKNGKPVLEPATITAKHLYPVAHMTPGEETSFQQAVETVNHAIRTRQCRFESDLDEEARIYFRYALLSSADQDTMDPQRIMDAIHLVIEQVHAGKAVRIEMPGGGVMLMPRWPIQTGEMH